MCIDLFVCSYCFFEVRISDGNDVLIFRFTRSNWLHYGTLLIVFLVHFTDETLNNEYQQAICECDRQAAECFLMNRKSYSKKLFDINVEKYC